VAGLAEIRAVTRGRILSVTRDWGRAAIAAVIHVLIRAGTRAANPGSDPVATGGTRGLIPGWSRGLIPGQGRGLIPGRDRGLILPGRDRGLIPGRGRVPIPVPGPTRGRRPRLTRVLIRGARPFRRAGSAPDPIHGLRLAATPARRLTRGAAHTPGQARRWPGPTHVSVPRAARTLIRVAVRVSVPGQCPVAIPGASPRPVARALRKATTGLPLVGRETRDVAPAANWTAGGMRMAGGTPARAGALAVPGALARTLAPAGTRTPAGAGIRTGIATPHSRAGMTACCVAAVPRWRRSGRAGRGVAAADLAPGSRAVPGGRLAAGQRTVIMTAGAALGRGRSQPSLAMADHDPGRRWRAGLARSAAAGHAAGCGLALAARP
jgi:hypothetical protein